MIGWHYTSESNWETIQREGLHPYPIKKYELRFYFPRGIRGIWVWSDPLSPRDELGSVLYQVSATKCDTRVVKLAVEYGEQDRLRWAGIPIRVTHSGRIGDWAQHLGDSEAWILVNHVPTSDIDLVETFDLMDVVRSGISTQS